MKRIYSILIIAIALIVIGFIYPIGLGITTPSISYYKNDTICFDCGVPPDFLVIKLLIILIPIIIIVGVIVLFYPSKNESNEKNI